MTIKAFVLRHAVTTYFVLTFAISWGGILLVVGGPAGFHGTAAQSDPLFPVVYIAMLTGPAVAGLLLNVVLRGRVGLLDVLARLLQWRVAARWYAVALLIAPLLIMSTLFILSLISPIFLPGIVTSRDKASLVLFGVAVGLGAGFFEELGWTGFAIPELRRRHGVLATGLLVGVLWGAWHFLAVIWGIGGSAGAIPLALFLPLDLFSGLPVYRVLMVWVYDRTGSLLVAILMHASLTASLLIFGPLAVSGAQLLTHLLLFAAALWIVVGAIGVASRGSRSRERLHTEYVRAT